MEPSTKNWDAILGLFDGWDGDELPSAINYAREHLKTWPDELKQYPEMELEELLGMPTDWPVFQLATSLQLGNCGIEARGAQALASSEAFKELITLDLSSNPLGAEGAKALARSKTLTQLTTLKLHNNGIEDGGAKALARSKALKNLKILDLRDNYISDEGAQALRQSKIFALQTLELEGNLF